MSEEMNIDNELVSNEMEIRSVDETKRIITGLAVPYNETTNRVAGGGSERIQRGAFGDVAALVGTPIFYGHDHLHGGLPVGRVVEAREAEDGLEIDAVISDETQKANEVYALLKDGTLSKFSVGFNPVKNRKENNTIVREQATLREISIVAMPAYANAAVSQVRADSNNTKENEVIMNEDTNTAPEVVELREQVSDLERKFAVMSEQGNTEAPKSASQYRSAGEALKAIAKGEDAGAMEMRAFTGATFADNDDSTRPAWVNEQLKLVAEKSPVKNLFTRKPLPAEGLSYVYPTVVSKSGTVGKQATEGADLSYVEVVTGTATASIDTYGGYTSLSRQLIERSEISFLDFSLRNLVNEYAVATEKAVRDKLVGATGVQTENLGTADTAANWTGVVLDSAALIEDNAKGPVAEVVVVSRDVFRRMATIVDTTGRPLFEVNGDGSNTVGSVNFVRVAGTVAGFPVVVIPTLAANSMFVLSSEALTIRDNGITSLQDENIINLTKDFSVYGYMAVEVNNPLAIVKVDADLV